MKRWPYLVDSEGVDGIYHELWLLNFSYREAWAKNTVYRFRTLFSRFRVLPLKYQNFYR